MKKISCIFLFIILLIPSLCFANYFDQYPKKYVVYDKTEQYKSYLDMDSVAVRRYDPPYYTIDVMTYSFDYVRQFGMAKQNRYFYNYETQTISWQVLNMGTCDEYGNVNIQYREEPLMTELIPLKKYSSGYLAAEFAFTKAYNMPFTIELQQHWNELANTNER